MWDYEQVKTLFQEYSKPLAVVDLDILDQNISRISQQVLQSKKRIRIASKSIRVPCLISYILNKGGDHFQGIMCFSVQEALYLARSGYDDLLIAYPRLHEIDLKDFQNLLSLGKKAYLMIDHDEHINILESFLIKNPGQCFPICLDLDMAYHPLGNKTHVGVQRSSIHQLDDLKLRLDRVQKSSACEIKGLMAYEAQIAGLPDQNPFSPALNPIRKALKNKSIKDVKKRRQEALELCQSRKIQLDFFNGGGTGSLNSSCQEDALTEVTAGSGFLQSHLFDYYKNNKNQAALLFALEITRKPSSKIVTCQSGGFIASGECSQDKAPLPYLPAGLNLLSNEGCGEVQTPLYGGENLKIGDPVFFRPAKAGEIAERFNEYYLLRHGNMEDTVPTYRGLGKTFY